MNRVLAGIYGGIREVKHPHCEKKLYYDGYRQLGYNFRKMEQIESAEFAFAAKVIGELRNACVWDIGANIGFWSLFLSDQSSSVSQVVCFEPDDANLMLLRKNRDENQITNWTIRATAVSDHGGTAVFHADDLTGATGSLEAGKHFIERHYGQRTRKTEVPLTSIDLEISHGTPSPAFIKIDVEGHELSVLKGGADFLRRVRPPLVIEVTRSHEEVGSQLASYGYGLWDAQTGKRSSFPTFGTVAIAL